MALSPGTRLGRFEITGLLGAGGMGEVYRARDPQLRRDVAIKVLPASFTNDSERLSRFHREALAVAALNHANVLTVYDVAFESGSPYIVSELLEGESLRQILRHGPLAPTRAIDLGIQIARGLQAAHEKGIVHRDLKPENIFLTGQHAKLLDFGIAKLLEADAPTGAETQTLNTSAGVVLGTVGYVSPEQLRGEHVDARSDLFAFGAVLYEMISARRAFDGKTQVDVISAVLNAEPTDLATDGHQLPAGLERIIQHCLQKNPGERFQSAVDLRFALENLGPSGRPVQTSAASPKPRRWIAATVLAVLALAAATGIWRWRGAAHKSGSPPDDSVRVTPLTTLPGMEISPSFSPDGSEVAFAWDGGHVNDREPFNLYVKTIGEENAQQLTHKAGEWMATAWSPDGSSIAFARMSASGTGIFVVPARGGPERKLADVIETFHDAFSVDWSPDGKSLLYESGGRIQILTVETGALREVASPNGFGQAVAPRFAPDGKQIAFSCFNEYLGSKLFVMSSDRAGARMIAKTDGSSPIAWTRDGASILYSDGETLRQVSSKGGTSRPLLFGNNGDEPAVSQSRDRLAFTRIIERTGFWRQNLGPDGNADQKPAPFLENTQEQVGADISPDGKKVAFESERLGSHEVWVANLDGSDPVQLSNFHSLTGSPRWSPDGSRVAFDSRVSGKAQIYIVDPDAGVPHKLPINTGAASLPSWSSDGKSIYFHSEDGFLYKVPVTGGNPTRVTNTPAMSSRELPNGKLLYFAGVESNSSSKQTGGYIMIRDLLAGQEHPLPGMPTVDYSDEWAAAPAGVYFVHRKPGVSAVGFYDFDAVAVTRSLPIEKDNAPYGGIAISPDQKFLIYAQTSGESDLVLVDGFR